MGRKNRRIARRDDLGLTQREFAILERLSTPHRIQRYVDGIPANHETDGETVLSVREVLRQRRAHCIEGALLAACALWIHGQRPLLMHLDCASSDFPHVVCLLQDGEYWGAISKTNHVPLRYRDPIYRTLRELAMSYFHEYCDSLGRQTLRSYSRPLDLRNVDHRLWVINEHSCWETHDLLVQARHFSLISTKQEGRLSRRVPFERRQNRVALHP